MVRNVSTMPIESAAHASAGNAVTNFASLINDWIAFGTRDRRLARLAEQFGVLYLSPDLH
ncbi:hypothetical protein DIE23_12220 [Burkholderia sp. Bp9143]|uniref:hypothetical protein n=1 Tax=Burkholderia sp. Bp9143 TaxID=2184574 RepID=UPI000F5A1CD7|nr:hypothetical protein [Burkholderia sp. Bp9143]RQR34386.1 hypothetical protein DIE23_12220 [Burkholderia sp. Bp9143]